MLEKLFIKNYLIIKTAELDFSEGLNILSGETGAGKTIILDALALILGERADYSIIKNENEKLIVEGHFIFVNNKNVGKFLKDKDLYIDKDNLSDVIIRRELSKKGISRNFINDTPVNISELKDFGDLIIDIHSQNEHQSLLKKETHINFLDAFIGNKRFINEYSHLFSDLKEKINFYEELIQKKDSLLEKKSYIEYQLREINNVNPLENEDTQLENDLKRLENSEEISLAVTNTLDYLYENENNALVLITNSLKELKKIAKYDDSIKKIIDILEENSAGLKTAADELRDYSANVNFEPEVIEQIRTRLSALTHLKKKYKLSVNDLIKKTEELTDELNLTENYDYEIDKHNKEIVELKTKTFEEAKKISQERKIAAKELIKNVNKYLKEVGLESAEFKINFHLISGNSKYTYKEGDKEYQFTNSGIDDIEFLIKANKGSDFSPLRKSASGGEISRIMLSLKAAMSGKDNIPILVFDEIDSGISGKIAGKVGKLLEHLSKSHQIISITHLPQIAAMSDNHYYVSKKDTQKETIAEIKLLNKEEKINEVARLLSSEKITELSIRTAEEMIGNKK